MCPKLLTSFRSTWLENLQINMPEENISISKKRGTMQKMSLRVGKRLKGSKSDKKELLRKLSSWREERKRESQRQLASLISSCSGGSVNQGIVDLAEEVCDLQAKLSAVTGTQFNRK